MTNGILYDFYGALLTDHQKAVYEAAVYEDLSLTEIAESFSISKQGVHDLIRRCTKQLTNYEEKLGLVKRQEAIRRELQALEEALSEIAPESPVRKKLQKHSEAIRSRLLAP